MFSTAKSMGMGRGEDTNDETKIDPFLQVVGNLNSTVTDANVAWKLK